MRKLEVGKTIILSNEFHETRAFVRPRKDRLTVRQLDRAARKLCGLRDCRCGKITGWQYQGDNTFVELSYDDCGAEVERWTEDEDD